MRVWRNKETIQWQKKCTSPLSLEKISSLIQKRCASIKHRAYQHRFSKPMTDECASSVDFGLVNLCGGFQRVFRCASQTIHARNVCTYIRTGIPQCQRSLFRPLRGRGYIWVEM